jgi:hypothetical protein
MRGVEEDGAAGRQASAEMMNVPIFFLLTPILLSSVFLISKDVEEEKTKPGYCEYER